MCVLCYEHSANAGRPSATSNEFIVRECPDRLWNVHRNVHLKPDPGIPNPNPRFSSFRSERNLWPLPASTNSFPHGAVTRNKQHHHLNVEPDLPGHRTLPLVFSLRRFPFVRLPGWCLLRQRRFGCQLVSVPRFQISYCFAFRDRDGCVKSRN